MTGRPGGQDADAERPTVLSRLQMGLESMYRVDTQLDVDTFLISDEARRDVGVMRAPREQLLVKHDGDDEVHIGLFVESEVVSNLEHHDPARGLHQQNFSDFCLAVEGVSHFVYVALCAAANRGVSALELELQAEVDKFACCLLVAGNGEELAGDPGVRGLRSRLYDEVRFADDLESEERDRYRTANQEARRYAESLSRAFVAQDRVSDMLVELRHFYRMALGPKLEHIARRAA